MTTESKEKLRRSLKCLIELILGCAIYAVSISVFYTPAKLLGGGVTGFAQLLNFSFGLPVSTMIVLINIPLFIVSLIFVDRRFTISSLIGMLTLSGFLQLTSGMHMDFTSPLTSVAVGGVLNGLGLGLIYRSEASAGGTDILAKIIQRYYSGNMAHTGLIINVVIVGISAFIHGLDQAVLTICAMYISSQVNTYIIDGIDHRRVITVITAKPDQVSDAILHHLNRGVTILKGTGGYTHTEHDMLYCVISHRELANMKRVIQSSDPDAFFTIARLTGVYGNGHGFRSVRKDIK